MNSLNSKIGENNDGQPDYMYSIICRIRINYKILSKMWHIKQKSVIGILFSTVLLISNTMSWILNVRLRT